MCDFCGLRVGSLKSLEPFRCQVSSGLLGRSSGPFLSAKFHRFWGFILTMELKGYSRGSVVIRGPEHSGSGTDDKKLEQQSAESLRSVQKLVNGCCIASARVFVPIGSRSINK